MPPKMSSHPQGKIYALHCERRADEVFACLYGEEIQFLHCKCQNNIASPTSRCWVICSGQDHPNQEICYAIRRRKVLRQDIIQKLAKQACINAVDRVKGKVVFLPSVSKRLLRLRVSFPNAFCDVGKDNDFIYYVHVGLKQMHF